MDKAEVEKHTWAISCTRDPLQKPGQGEVTARTVEGCAHRAASNMWTHCKHHMQNHHPKIGSRSPEGLEAWLNKALLP